MPPRNTLAWEICELCGRHIPTIECTIGDKKVKLCSFCLFLYRDLCKELKSKISKETSFMPNEELIESISKKNYITKKKSSKRRASKYY